MPSIQVVIGSAINSAAYRVARAVAAAPEAAAGVLDELASLNMMLECLVAPNSSAHVLLNCLHACRFAI